MNKHFRKAVRRFALVPPPLILSAIYAIFIVVGAIVLKLPISHTKAITWSDALFTATSAVTVTGLVVLDTGADFTLFGQIVIAFLIQLGGLGLMTFAVLVLGALGLPIGITGHIYLRDDLNQNSMAQLTRLVKTILKVVFILEVGGALVLAITFVPDYGLMQGAWESIFHSISAFNNAGFSTFPNGLVGYATDPIVNIVIPGLFILGGIGYVVFHDIFRQKNWRSWSLHTKIMLLGTGILIPLSVGLFAVLEWNNPRTLGQFDSSMSRMIVSWFQGVTTRTAGFNTTDIGGMHDSTSMMFIALMLIGGGPASTAGGIKVTTFVVMLLATVAFFKRQQQLHAFGRSISLEHVLKVMALIAISFVLVFVAVFLLTASHEGHFLDICFEVASAYGTVGLSRGYTGELSDFGRAIIITVMFLGRVGPLTLGFFIATRTTPRVRYPEGSLHLG